MTSSYTMIKKLVLYYPDDNMDEMMHKLEKLGYMPSRFTVATVRMDFRFTLKFLRKEGYDVDGVEPPIWIQNKLRKTKRKKKKKDNEPTSYYRFYYQ